MFKNALFSVSYSVNDEIFNFGFENQLENEHLTLLPTVSNNKIELTIFPKTTLKLNKLKAQLNYPLKRSDAIFVNGFQSWTNTKEFSNNQTIKRLSFVAKLLNPIFKFRQYGDMNIFKQNVSKNQLYGFDFVYVRHQDSYTLFASQIPQTVYTTFLFSTKQSKIEIFADVEGMKISMPTTIMNVIGLKGDYKLIENYFDTYTENKSFKPITGWTSWYNYYQNIDQTIILQNIENFAKYFPAESIFQIDDGYQTAVGDWLSIDKNKFPNGLEQIVQKIHTNGYKAGIWLAPFAAQKNSDLVKNHPNWILKDQNDKKIYGGSNWGGFYALDFYNQEVQEYLSEVFDIILNKWQFDLVKLDFLYAVAIIPQKGKSRAIIMSEAMNFLRKIVGHKKILACGVPLAQSFGKVDYCRIGPDMGLSWKGNFIDKWIHRERVSTTNSLYNTIYRRFLDKRVFQNDPDVFLLRDDNIQMSKEQRITIYLINSIFGSLVFTSDDFSKYDQWQLLLLKNLQFFVNAKVILTIEKQGLFEFIFEIEDKKLHAFSNFTNNELEIENTYENQFDIYKLKLIQKNGNIIKPYETLIYGR